MEFNEKLQALRKDKGLTQEELAEALYVSRTAISKWESGRGYPNIESLKAISRYFSVSVDELLSSHEVLNIAQEDNRQKEKYFCDLVFGLLDCSGAMLLFLPFFGQTWENSVQEVSLLALTAVAPWLKVAFFAVTAAMILWGILTLALQNCHRHFWENRKSQISLLWNWIAAILFVLSRQPYAAVFVFVFLTIKVLMLMKKL